MADPQSKYREIAWDEWFPWLLLVRSVRVALMARVIVLGTLGLLLMTFGWWVIARMFTETQDPVIQQWHRALGIQSSESLTVPSTELRQWLGGDSRAFLTALSARSAEAVFYSATTGLKEAPVAMWLHFTRPFRDLFDADLTGTGFLFLLLCCIWELLVWGIAGGAITRIAALKLTRDEAPGLVAALRYALNKMPSYSLAPLMALAGAGVFAIQLVGLGLLMNFSFFAMLAGLFWPFVLLLGLLMAILLIGALVGWPLMWATVSVEGTDAFDSLSRSYAYTYQRPWRLLWYVLFAGFLAAVSMFVVKLFAVSAVGLGDWSVDWGLKRPIMEQVVKVLPPPVDESNVAPPAVVVGPPVEAPAAAAAPEVDEVQAVAQDGMLGVARGAIQRWKMLVFALAAGYQAGFLFVSAVGVYLLLRRDIDGVELNEVFTDGDDEFGMPPLVDDAATGVPEVAAREPAQPGDRASAS